MSMKAHECVRTKPRDSFVHTYSISVSRLLLGNFWDDKPAGKWTDQEVVKVMTDSPWAQMVPAPAKNSDPLQFFFATAAPVEQAEQERERPLSPEASENKCRSG